MVRYAARLSGLPSTEALRRSHEVLDWCDAGQERYRPVETLSVGTRQKVEQQVPVRLLRLITTQN
jgi:ABC-2 type transport system ATP-binding protein